MSYLVVFLSIVAHYDSTGNFTSPSTTSGSVTRLFPPTAYTEFVRSMAMSMPHGPVRLAKVLSSSPSELRTRELLAA